MSALLVNTTAEGVRFGVHVQPKASRSEIVGLHGDALKIRLQAPPVDGAANEALVHLVAASLGLPRAAVQIVAGLSSRRKTVEVRGVSAETIHRLVD